MTELNKNLPDKDQPEEGAEPEVEPKSFWFLQPAEPVSTEHQQFLDAIVKATSTTTNNNSQQLP